MANVCVGRQRVIEVGILGTLSVCLFVCQFVCMFICFVVFNLEHRLVITFYASHRFGYP